MAHYRIEAIDNRELLSYYTKQQFPDQPLLVIWDPINGSPSELDLLKEELDDIGYGVCDAAWTQSVILVAMPYFAITDIISKHDHGSVRIEYWKNGQCIHENM